MIEVIINDEPVQVSEWLIEVTDQYIDDQYGEIPPLPQPLQRDDDWKWWDCFVYLQQEKPDESYESIRKRIWG